MCAAARSLAEIFAGIWIAKKVDVLAFIAPHAEHAENT
jgi:hypothetical protein